MGSSPRKTTDGGAAQHLYQGAQSDFRSISAARCKSGARSVEQSHPQHKTAHHGSLSPKWACLLEDVTNPSKSRHRSKLLRLPSRTYRTAAATFSRVCKTFPFARCANI